MESRKIVTLLTAVLAIASIAGAAPTLLTSGQTGYRAYLSTDGQSLMYVNIKFFVWDQSTGAFAGAPGTEQFVYQYIVENRSDSELAIDKVSFVAAAGAGMSSIGTAWLVDGIDATPAINSTATEESADFAFNLTGDLANGKAPLAAGKSSYQLLLTSDNTYTSGEAIVTGGLPESDLIVPDSQTPEPVTVLLLGLGGLGIVTGRRS